MPKDCFPSMRMAIKSVVGSAKCVHLSVLSRDYELGLLDSAKINLQEHVPMCLLCRSLAPPIFILWMKCFCILLAVNIGFLNDPTQGHEHSGMYVEVLTSSLACKGTMQGDLVM